MDEMHKTIRKYLLNELHFIRIYHSDKFKFVVSIRRMIKSTHCHSLIPKIV